MQVKDTQLFSRFLSFLKPHQAWVWISIFTVPFSTGSSLLIPWLIIKIIDDYLTRGTSNGLDTMMLYLGASIAIGYIADALYNFSLQKAGLKTIYDMRQSLFAHTLELKRNYFDTHPVGTTLTRLTSDMESLGESLAVGALSLFTDIIKTVALFVFLFYLSWKLTLVVLLVMPFILISLHFLRQKLRTYYNRTRETLSQATGFLQECLNGIKTIQLYTSEEKVFGDFKEKNQHFLKAQIKSNTYDAVLFSLIEGITSVTVALILWYGTGAILDQVLTIGVLVGFLNTLNRIFVPIREFTQQISIIQRSLAAAEHIEELFLQSIETTENNPSNTHENLDDFSSIEFKNVYFRYKENTPYILKDVSFKINRGDSIALVGATGSGKSTIIKLLGRQYENYEGSILLNGIELRRIPRKKISEIMSIMQQDPYLFNETVEFNIGLQRNKLTLEKIQQATQYVYADQFIENLPGKYRFIIEDQGTNLSAGQSQLIAFARAIASDTDLFILDEATSAVDSVTEESIKKAIEKIFNEKTVIAIAHRLSTIQHSDNILVIDQGELIESGNHETLLKTNGKYSNLIESLSSL